MKRRMPSLIFFFLGAFSLLSQTILIREYLVAFHGNEIAIGVFYASWFFWIALGASLILLKKNLARHFLKYLSIYPLLPLIGVYFFRSLRGLANIEPWEFFPLQKAIPLTVLLNAPFSFFTGIIFTSGCRFLKTEREKDSEVISRAYIYESIGSFLAGVTLTAILMKLIELLPFLIFSALLFLIVSFVSAIIFKDKIGVCLSLTGLIFYSGIPLTEDKLIQNLKSLRWRYILPQAKLVDEISTPYQYLSIARLKSQLILLSNGKIIEAFPDKISGYQMSALFVSMGDLPQEILVFGYGSENYIRYLLDFPLKSITYVIPDRAYFEFLIQYFPPELKPLLKSRKIKIFFQDPKTYLATSKKKYDLIIANLPDPSTASLNKYFTSEFYNLVKEHLTPNGAFATKITSAENFIGSEIRNYGSSIYYTLKDCFEKTVIIPGEINWFFGGKKNSRITQEPEILVQRYKKYITLESTFYPEGFYSLMPKNRVEFLKEVYLENPLFKRKRLINSDRKPLSYFLNLLVLARYTNSELVKILKTVFITGWLLFILPIILFLFLRIHYLISIENNTQNKLIFNSKLFQLFSGASGFIYHLTLMFLFQNRFGILFQLIGLVNSLFMLGLFSGSLMGKKLITKFNPLKLIFTIVTIQTLLYFASYPILEKFLPLISEKISFITYLILFFSSGMLTGSSYPLAGKILENSRVQILNLAGSLESLDHWGASLGALLAGIILIPLLGIYKTLLLLGIMSSSVLALISLELNIKVLKEKKINSQRLSFPYIRTSYILFTISLWSLFTFNYIEHKKIEVSEPPVSPILSEYIKEFEKSEFRLKPLPHYLSYKGNKPYYIFQSQTLGTGGKGFGGKVEITLVIDGRQTIKKILISGPGESPPHLERVKSWIKNFEGEKIGFFTDSKKNIDGVTGATITSNAVIEALRKTSNLVKEKFFQELSSEDKKFKFRGLGGALIFSLYTLIGLFLLHFNKSRKVRFIYLITLILILGFRLNLQLSSSHILNLLSFNFPAIKNLNIFLLVLIPFILGIFYGRFYCGWLCPFGALQEIINFQKLRLKPSEEFDKKARYFKYLLLTIIIVLFSIARNTNIYQEEPLIQAFIPTPMGEKILLLSGLFFSLFFFRFWCRYLCIVGALLSLFNKIAILKSRLKKKALSECKLNLKNLKELDCLQCKMCLKDEER